MTTTPKRLLRDCCPQPRSSRPCPKYPRGFVLGVGLALSLSVSACQKGSQQEGPISPGVPIDPYELNPPRDAGSGDFAQPPPTETPEPEPPPPPDDAGVPPPGVPPTPFE